MISKRLIASAGIVTALFWASAASATTVSIGLQEASQNGGAVTQMATGSDFAVFGGSYGSIFNITIDSGSLGNTQFITQSQNQFSGAGTLKVYVTASGLTDPTGAFAVLSSFTENALASGVSVTQQTYFNADNAIFGTETLLGQHTFTGPFVTTQTASSLNLADVLQTPYSITALYTIVTTVAGSNNSTIDMSVQTPLPGTLPLIAGGLGALWMVGRKRKVRKTPAVA
jgi:hypothetical protein